MNCHQYQKHLDLYLDGQLPPRQRWALDAHLGHCPQCRQALINRYQTAWALEGLAPPSAPKRLLPRIITRVTSHGVPRPSPMARWASRAQWVMGLMGALAGLALLVLGSGSSLSTALSSTTTLAQEPDFTIDGLLGFLGAGLGNLADLADQFLLGIPALEASLLLGGCLLLLSTGGLILRTLGQPPEAALSSPQGLGL